MQKNRDFKSLFEQRVRRAERGGLVSRLSHPSGIPAWLAQRSGLQIEVTAPLFFCEGMRIKTGEVVSRGIASFGYSEKALTALMLDRVKPGDTFVDVGTHFGYEAMLAASLVGSGGRVIAFEPNPAVIGMARKNLTRFPQVDLREAGVSDSPGTLYIGDPAASAFVQLSERGGTAVPVCTLDEAVQGPVSFLKVDVEGMEAKVIGGAQAMLRANKPVVVLEADMPNADGSPTQRAFDLAQQMKDLGFEPYSFDYTTKLLVGPLGSFPVHHANILFLPR